MMSGTDEDSSSLGSSPLQEDALAGRAIALYARRSPGLEGRWQAAAALLARAARSHPGQIVFATSLGAEDQVVTALIAEQRLPIALATLNTGQLHPQTVALIEQTERHFGVSIRRFEPDPTAVVDFVSRHGSQAMRQSVALRKACCALRKLEPLERLLHGQTAWVTGLRRGQSQARAEVPEVSLDDAGRTKWSPLAMWSDADVWQTIAERGIPYNPLHDAFMPSIGCQPCTRAVAVGEDARAGRWWWESDRQAECGLHIGGQHSSDLHNPSRPEASMPELTEPLSP